MLVANKQLWIGIIMKGFLNFDTKYFINKNACASVSLKSDD